MYRVITATKSLDDREFTAVIGNAAYDKLYKKCCAKMDEQIYAEYGDVEVRWTNMGIEAVENNDGTYTLTNLIDASFETMRGNTKYCYGEVTCLYDPTNPQSYSPQLTYFTDEVEYE